jgi:hypothetical protein
MLPAMDFDELNDHMARSNARARSGRALAWLMFSMTAALVGFVAFLALVDPPCGGLTCPMFIIPASPNIGDALDGLAAVGLAAGLLWMWRIVRSDGDPEARSWRYRDRS